MNYFSDTFASHVLTFLLGGLFMLLSLFGSGCGIFKTRSNERVDLQKLLLITEGNFMYLAGATAAYTDEDTELQVHIFNPIVQEKVGDRIPRERVATTRVEPPEGWGSSLVALQYLWEDNWIYTQKATEFADYYLVSVSDGEDRKIALSDVRFPILIPR